MGRRPGVYRQLIAASLAAVLMLVAAAGASAEQIFMTTGTGFARFDSLTPSLLSPILPITGLQANETILAIDCRPATGQIYGLGSTSRLYTINPSTGVATLVGLPNFTLVGTA